ncbi:DUF3035 domain-containing protein [Dongia sp.]|uniref:DUF3035 domain-containing protein n=1 Tax=Dongia sp. TaxID=1977262 RepID=UPI0035B2821F
MRSKLLISTLCLLALPALAGGCSNTTREALGLTKRSPDEFQVVSNAPLSMPPDYNLRPPTPGAPRPQEGTVREQAERVVFGYPDAGGTPSRLPEIGVGEASSAQSAGEASLLQSAGIAGVDPNIRQVVDTETASDEADSQQMLDAIVFWRKPEPYGTVVNPTEEQKRLQENAALGAPPTQGTVPTIERRQKGVLEGLF